MKALALAALAALAACGGPAAPTPDEPATPVEPAPEAAADPDLLAKQIAVIQGAINDGAPGAHACWARAAADDFRLDGAVILRLEVGKLGDTRSVTVATDEPKDAVLTDCLVQLWEGAQWPPIFDEGDVIQLPPFEFVAPDAQYVVASENVPAREQPDGTAGGGTLGVQVILDAESTGQSAAAVSLIRAADRGYVDLHRHPEGAELLYVLSGTGRLLDQRVYPPRGDRSQARAESGTAIAAHTAIYVPAGVAHGFHQTGTEPLVLLQVRAPGGPEVRFANPVAKDAAEWVTPEERGTRKARREPTPRTTHIDDHATHDIAGGKGRVRILFEDAPASLMLLEAEPGTQIPEHTHDGATEILYVLDGTATLTVDGDPLELSPGSAAAIPPGTRHAGTMTGDGTFRAVQLYTPAGPEQRFKKGSK